MCITDNDEYSALKDEATRKEEEQRLKEEQRQVRAQQKSQNKKEKQKKKKEPRESQQDQLKIDKIRLSDNDDGVVCPICSKDIDGLWICCDVCDTWFHVKCLKLSPRNIPDVYTCVRCI